MKKLPTQPAYIFVANTKTTDYLHMELSKVELSKIVANDHNPRIIRDAKFQKLLDSILTFPEMLELRPIVVDDAMVVLGGNMRLRALQELAAMTDAEIVRRLGRPKAYKELPEEKKSHLGKLWRDWRKYPYATIVRAAALTDAQKREFIIKDNVGFGEWDWDALANEWDSELLSDWGMDIPGENDGGSKADKDDVGNDDEEYLTEDEDKDAFYLSMLSDCLYESNNLFDIPNLLLDMQAGKLQLPFSPYGAESRQKKGIATYHFYVEDYRFEAIWKDPTKVLQSGCSAIVEPNLSLFDTTPVAWGLQQIYKKRWISRYFQECGVKVYADLNVAKKFYEYNRMGIPDGYNAFCTRGYAERIDYLKLEHNIAKEISGKDTPNLIVYGGDKSVREYCAKHSLLYVEQLMTRKREERDG